MGIVLEEVEKVELSLYLPSGSSWSFPGPYMFSIGPIIRCLYACINVYSQGKSYELNRVGFHVTLFVS